MRWKRAAAGGMLLVLAGLMVACSSDPEAEETSSDASPPVTQSVPAETPAETPGSGGCPDTVFTVWKDREGLAEAEPGQLFEALGVELQLPSEPGCTVAWIDPDDAAPRFVMFWPGYDYEKTFDGLNAALHEAAGLSCIDAPTMTSCFVVGHFEQITLSVRYLAPDEFSDAVGESTAILIGPDLR